MTRIMTTSVTRTALAHVGDGKDHGNDHVPLYHDGDVLRPPTLDDDGDHHYNEGHHLCTTTAATSPILASVNH